MVPSNTMPKPNFAKIDYFFRSEKKHTHTQSMVISFVFF
jgi:hypothetical protein